MRREPGFDPNRCDERPVASTIDPESHARILRVARQKLRRVVFQTGDPMTPGARAQATEITRMVVSNLGELVGLDPELQLVLGTEGVPADVASDAPLCARLRREFPQSHIVYRARIDHGGASILARIADAGATSFELDVAVAADPGAALKAAVESIGIAGAGPRVSDSGAAGAQLSTRIRVGGAELDLVMTARSPWPNDDAFARWHPCAIPFEEVSLWVDGRTHTCREQSVAFGDEVQGDWRRDGLAGVFAGSAADAFRSRHRDPRGELPACCRSCPHPAEPWLLAERRKLLAFRDRHRGARAFVLGNGPSLGAVDLRRLKGEITFGVNRIHEAYDALGLDPVTYFCVSDPVVWRLLDRSARRARARQVFLRWPDVETAEDSAILLPQRDYELQMADGWFPSDPAQGLARGKTVLLDLCLPLAFWMGFEEVVLIGCDFSWDPRTDNHFYSDRNEPWRHPGTREAWQPPVDEQKEGMKVARAAFAARGRRLLNASPGGNLDVLERVDFRSLFGGP